MIGKSILHYKILSKLGEGGMGVVYKAEDAKLKRKVAIKFLPRQAAASEEERERFRIEAQSAAGLNHANIATIYNIEEADEEAFIVMEYVDGNELKASIDTGPLPIDDTLDMAVQIAQGLQAAHEKGVVHRDIKSANIMRTRKGEVKIMDFGLAKVGGQTKLTQAGTTLGTVAYMSPEQTRGVEVDHRSDIFSLGVLIYEMLTGQLPFKGDYDQAVTYSILNEEPEPPTALRTGIPLELERIVNKCLRKETSERYQHADELIVDLRGLKKETETIEILSQTGAMPAQKRVNRSVFLLPAVAGALILTVLAYMLMQPTSNEPVAQKKMLVVLPFDNLGPPDDDYFANGITEAITARVASISGIGVISRQSAMQYKGSDKGIREIGEELNVSYVLQGTVQRERPNDSSSRVRIIPQLIGVRDDTHLWADTYDEGITEVFRVQSEIAERIAHALDITLLEPDKKTLAQKPTDSPEAYNLYLKGRYFWNRRSKDGLYQSIDYFNQAIGLDPTYALAYSGLADAYIILGVWQHLDSRDAYPKAKAAAQRALEIDSSLAEAYAVLAKVEIEYNWNWPAAELAFKKAIALNPGYATAHQWYSEFLSSQGRIDEAEAEIKEALKLDPLSLIISAMSGWNYQIRLQDDEALKVFDKIAEIDPDFPPIHYYAYMSYYRLGKMDDMFRHFVATFSPIYDLTGEEQRDLQEQYAKSGWQEIISFMIERHGALSQKRYISSANLSKFYVIIDDHNKAIDYLEEAFEMRDIVMPFIHLEPIFYKLHEEPRFRTLMQKIGLPH